MNTKLHFQTTSKLLKSILLKLMNEPIFNDFRLVGGTALSLQLGHRISVDIDLFSDLDYGAIDFNQIDSYLEQNFSYVDSSKIDVIGMGKSYFIGDSENECIKLDVYYTDKFIQKPLNIEGVRMATIEEIIAMKVDVISRGGRKKDFWDLHALMDKFSFYDMLNLHQKRYPYSHEIEKIKSSFLDFEYANEDFEPICLKQKYWELIKLDFIDYIK